MMRNQLFLAALGLVLGLAGAASAEDPAKVGQTSAGPALTDPAGMTLYTFTRDMPGASNCNGACATAWPPFAAGPADKGGGDWSVIQRDDGKPQWAHKGEPLYRYAQDKAPGDASGEGAAAGKWHVAKP
jgi:predicted lipoprotein with Yx(FWY)xxD motif